METSSPLSAILAKSRMWKLSDGLRIFMAKTKKSGSPCGLTPVLPDTVWLFQVNSRDDSFVAAADIASSVFCVIYFEYVNVHDYLLV